MCPNWMHYVCDAPRKSDRDVRFPVALHTLFDSGSGQGSVFSLPLDSGGSLCREAPSGRSSELQSLLLRLATDLVKVAAEQQDTAIGQALATVGHLIGADRAFLCKYDFESGILSNSHEWCADGIAPTMNGVPCLPMALFSEVVEAHCLGKSLYIPCAAALDQGTEFRRVLESENIQSLLTLPLKHNESCLGFVEFDAMREKRTWTPEEIGLLRVLAELLSNAESRRASERENTRLNEVQGLLLDAMDVQVWHLKDPENCLFVNKAHAEFLGIDREDLQRKQSDALLSPEVADKLRYLRSKIFEDVTVFNIRLWIHNRHGEPRLLAITKIPKLASDGSVDYVVCVARDTTELERTRQQLETSERRYLGLSEMQHLLIIREDVDGCFTFANEAYCKTFGKRQEELFGQRFQPAIHPEDLPATLRAMRQFTDDPQHSVHMEHRNLTADGWRWLAWEVAGVFDDSGTVVEIHYVGRDITGKGCVPQNQIMSILSQSQAEGGYSKCFSAWLALQPHSSRAG